MNPKVKQGLIIGGVVFAAIVVYQYVSPSGAANQDSGDGTPSIATSLKLGTATVTAGGSAFVLLYLLALL